jgi:hypothetical protein
MLNKLYNVRQEWSRGFWVVEFRSAVVRDLVAYPDISYDFDNHLPDGLTPSRVLCSLIVI